MVRQQIHEKEQPDIQSRRAVYKLSQRSRTSKLPMKQETKTRGQTHKEAETQTHNQTPSQTHNETK
ncbi:unnamed protein product, partial [Nesidiocoris tenuis]